MADKVVLLNVRVADAVAARYAHRGVPLDDLQQTACEGLVKAVERFDVTMHKDLLTYAVPTIRGEVLRYFRDTSWTVRPPRRLQELRLEISRTTEELGAELGRTASTEEMCEALDVDAEEYAEASSLGDAMNPASLDEPLTEGASTNLGDTCTHPVDDHPSAEARAILSAHLGSLTDRERRVLYLRYYEERTQQEIGDELGVGQTQVSRWLASILTRLRQDIGAAA